jgi:hypothetical protein
MHWEVVINIVTLGTIGSEGPRSASNGLGVITGVYPFRTNLVAFACK